MSDFGIVRQYGMRPIARRLINGGDAAASRCRLIFVGDSKSDRNNSVTNGSGFGDGAASVWPLNWIGAEIHGGGGTPGPVGRTFSAGSAFTGGTNSVDVLPISAGSTINYFPNTGGSRPLAFAYVNKSITVAPGVIANAATLWRSVTESLAYLERFAKTGNWTLNVALTARSIVYVNRLGMQGVTFSLQGQRGGSSAGTATGSNSMYVSTAAEEKWVGFDTPIDSGTGFPGVTATTQSAAATTPSELYYAGAQFFRPDPGGGSTIQGVELLGGVLAAGGTTAADFVLMYNNTQGKADLKSYLEARGAALGGTYRIEFGQNQTTAERADLDLASPTGVFTNNIRTVVALLREAHNGIAGATPFMAYLASPTTSYNASTEPNQNNLRNMQNAMLQVARESGDVGFCNTMAACGTGLMNYNAGHFPSAPSATTDQVHYSRFNSVSTSLSLVSGVAYAAGAEWGIINSAYELGGGSLRYRP